MVLTLAHIGSSAQLKDGTEPLVQVYLDRCSQFARMKAEGFRSQAAFFEWLGRQQGRMPAVAVLLDSRGKQLSSENFARWLGGKREEGVQHIVFAIGPADGWTEAERLRAGLLLSLGPMTLAHSLARLVMAEQVYRAFAILSGHPYHSGH